MQLAIALRTRFAPLRTIPKIFEQLAVIGGNKIELQFLALLPRRDLAEVADDAELAPSAEWDLENAIVSWPICLAFRELLQEELPDVIRLPVTGCARQDDVLARAVEQCPLHVRQPRRRRVDRFHPVGGHCRPNVLVAERVGC